MNRRIVLAAGMVCFSVCLCASAMDRSAKMSDSVMLEARSFTGGYGLEGELWGETATAALSGRWAIVAGLGGGKTWYDDGSDPQFLDASLGVKNYLFPLTGVSLYGTYGLSDMGRGPDATAATLEVKQRLLSADKATSPFLKGEARVVNSSKSLPSNPMRAVGYSQFVGSIGAGVDFLMREDFAIVFEGSYFATESIHDAPGPWAGFAGAVYMKYYWY